MAEISVFLRRQTAGQPYISKSVKSSRPIYVSAINAMWFASANALASQKVQNLAASDLMVVVDPSLAMY
jgi:hypothetical protein